MFRSQRFGFIAAGIASYFESLAKVFSVNSKIKRVTRDRAMASELLRVQWPDQIMLRKVERFAKPI